MDVSIVVPVYNERDNLVALYRQLDAVLTSTGKSFEIVMVDDGSTDDSFERLKALAMADHRLKIVRFRRNYGQTAAMQAGMQLASGDVDRHDGRRSAKRSRRYSRAAVKIDAGYDLVHGWRKNRQDPLINRRLPSMLANWLISRTTGFPIHDLGCTLKAIRREIAQELELYGEMHRFIPILAHQRGARCLEVVTRHHARRFGRSKYGISRTLRVLLDLITVKYVLDYFPSPMKLFGLFGILCGFLGAASGAGTVAMKLGGSVDMTGNPLLLLSIFLLMAGLQFLSLGLLGEVCARIYYGLQTKQNYAVRETVNLETRLAVSAMDRRHAA